MAYTLAEIQAVLANLKATYLSLTTKLSSQFAQRDRDVTYVELAKVRAEIEVWEAREQLLEEQSDGAAGGVAYVNFQRAS